MPSEILNNGMLRRLYAVDEPAFASHLLRLDAAARHDRFGMGMSDAALTNYANGCFGPWDLVYGFFVDGEIRAAGELRQLVKTSFAVERKAEAAFSVEYNWRRLGLGTALMRRIVRAAQNRRDATLHLMCLADNRAMQGLARKFDAELEFATDQVTGRLTARHVSPLSLMNEAIDDASGLAQAMVDARRRKAELAPAV